MRRKDWSMDATRCASLFLGIIICAFFYRHLQGNVTGKRAAHVGERRVTDPNVSISRDDAGSQGRIIG